MEQTIEAQVPPETVEFKHVTLRRPVSPIGSEVSRTIVPVVQEAVITSRRLILEEKIHLRRVQRTERQRETPTLQQQHAVVERAGPEANGIDRSAPNPEFLKEENPQNGL